MRSCLVALFMAGCAPGEFADLPGEQLPPPLTVAAWPLTPGSNVQLVAAGANPGELVRFAGSVSGLGLGPCPPLLNGECLGVRDPAFLLGAATANSEGRATLTLRVPSPAPAANVYLQAAVLSSGPAVLSPAISAPMSGSCAPGLRVDCNGLCFSAQRYGDGRCDDGTAQSWGAPDFDCPLLLEDDGDCSVAPPPTDPEACYLGSNRAGNTCVDVVDYSTAFGSDYDYPAPLDSRYPEPVRYVDLDVANPSLAVAPNFVLDEFMQAWKGRYGVLQPFVVDKMQSIRDSIGGALLVTSGYRSPGYNAGVGGATWSRHMYGDGMDMFTSAVTLATLQARCQAQGASFTQLYTGHVHCDWRDLPPAPEFFDPGFAFTGQAPPPPLQAVNSLPEMSAELIPGAVWTAPAVGWDEGEPLREWTAFDRSGRILEEVTATEYVPPAGAAKVSVWVGREVHLERMVEGS